MQRFLAHCQNTPQKMVIEPLIIHMLEMAIAHTRQSAPGPDGVPYTARAKSGPGGTILIYRVYLALLHGETALDWLKLIASRINRFSYSFPKPPLE